MAITQQNGLESTKFYYGTLAEWEVSNIILSVNEIAIVTDQTGLYKQGQALPSMGSANSPQTGPSFNMLPWLPPTRALQVNVKDNQVLGDGVTDDAPALNQLINLYAALGNPFSLFLPDSTYLIKSTILFTGDDQCLIGSSRPGTIIMLANNANCHMVSSTVLGANDNRINNHVLNMTLNGNSANQTLGGDFHGIHFENQFPVNGLDTYHKIDNVDVKNTISTGVFIQGRMGEGQFTNITCDFAYLQPSQPYATSGKSVYFNTWDAMIGNIKCGHNTIPLTITGTNNQCYNMIGFGSTQNSVYIGGARNRVMNVDAQDSANIALFITGENNIVTAGIDSCGWNFVTNSITPNATYIYMDAAAVGCSVTAAITDREEFSGGQPTGAWALYCAGTYNKVDITFQKVLSGVVNDIADLSASPNWQTNKITAIGSLNTGVDYSIGSQGINNVLGNVTTSLFNDKNIVLAANTTAVSILNMTDARLTPGKKTTISNQNTSGSFGSFCSANVHTLAGTQLNTIPNNAITELLAIGSFWVKVN